MTKPTSAAVLWLLVLGWWSATLSVVVAAAAAAGGSSYDFSSYRPPVCIAAGQRCYDTSQAEPENKYSDCCDGHKCVGGPWSATCQKCTGSNGHCTTSDLPQSDPKGIAGLDYKVQTIAEANYDLNTCPYMTNVGSTLGASTGYDSEPFPLLGQNNIYTPAGRESQVAILIGGNYVAPQAAELEGKIVVLGDFLIGSRGTNSLGT